MCNEEINLLNLMLIIKRDFKTRRKLLSRNGWDFTFDRSLQADHLLSEQISSIEPLFILDLKVFNSESAVASLFSLQNLFSQAGHILGVWCNWKDL
jgi:hypothetical protein